MHPFFELQGVDHFRGFTMGVEFSLFGREWKFVSGWNVAHLCVLKVSILALDLYQFMVIELETFGFYVILFWWYPETVFIQADGI